MPRERAEFSRAVDAPLLICQVIGPENSRSESRSYIKVSQHVRQFKLDVFWHSITFKIIMFVLRVF